MANLKAYTVNRSMVGDKEYARGDVRELNDADAARMLANGAISHVDGSQPKPVTKAAKVPFNKAEKAPANK